MDTIYKCASDFSNLLSTKYNFIISHNRKTENIIIDFKAEDFRHVIGLHYVDDITIEKDPAKVIPAILENRITDEVLSKSDKYIKKLSDGGSVRERVEELCFLERYLDSSDYIRIYKMQDFGSQIRADYFIEATNKERKTTVYIFIRKRIENNNFVIVSFFKKYSVFKGIAAYWMLKEKIMENEVIELYRNNSYKGLGMKLEEK